MPSKRAKHPVNQPIVNMLEEERESVDSDNLKQTYGRAIRNIVLASFPITSKQEALQIHCVGKYIATKIDVYLRRAQGSTAAAAAAALARQQARVQGSGASSSMQTQNGAHPDFPPGPTHTSPRIQEQAPSGAVVMPVSDDEAAAEVNGGGRGRSRGRGRGRGRATSRGRGGTRSPRVPKEYKPAIRSGGFGFLLVLLDALDEGVNQLSRVQVQSRAQKYCDEPVVKAKSADRGTHYDGWSSMSTLIKNGLVAKHSSPAWYLLTMTGVECAKWCRQMNVDAAAYTIRKYGQVVHESEGSGKDNTEEHAGEASVSRHPGGGSCADVPSEQTRANQRTRRGAMPPGPTGEFALVHPEEFGCPGDKPPGRKSNARRVSAGRSSGRSGGRPSDPQVNRSAIACERCEADGYGRAECMDVLRAIYDAGELPSSSDSLYGMMHDRLWERRQASLQRERPNRPTFISLRGGSAPGLGRGPESSSVRAADSVNPSRSQGCTAATAQPDSAVVVSQILRSPKGRISRNLDSNIESRPSGHNRDSIVQANIELSQGSGIEELKSSRVSPEIGSQAVDLTSPTAIPDSGQASGSVQFVPPDDKENSVIDLSEEISDQPPSPILRKRPRADIAKNHIGRAGSSEEHRKSKAHRVSRPSNEVVNIVEDDILEVDEITPAAPGSAGNIQSYNSGQHTLAGDLSVQVAGLPTSNQSTLASVGHEMECKIVLILDTMERTRRNTLSEANVNTMASMLSENGVTCEVRQLPCGDALFIAQFVDGTEVVLDYLIERKTIDDFAASMYDGRVARQSYMMSQSRIERRMFVLEGNINDNQQMRDKPEYMKKLAQLEICDDFYVKRTKDLRDTIWFYSSMYNRLCRDFHGYPMNAVLEGRSLFPDWNARMKTLKNGLTLEQLFALQLCQIQGISTTTALAILKMGYNTPQALYRAFQNEPDPQRRETLLADSQEGITKRTSRLLCKLFTAADYGTEVLEDQ